MVTKFTGHINETNTVLIKLNNPMLDPYVKLFTKTNLNWTKDLNVRTENIKILQKNIKKPQLLGVGLDNIWQKN